MKKSLLILSLVMVLCLSLAFAACQPTVELEPETLKRMQDYLINTYRNVDPDFTYNMPTVVNVKGQTANVQWTVNTTEGPADVVKVGAAEGTNQAIEINFRTEQDVKYTLTGTIVNEKGEAYTIDEKPVTVSFDRTVSKFVLNTYEEYAAACVAGKEDVSITIIGYVVGVVNMESSSAGSLYLQDKDGNGYYAYAPTGATSGCETNEQLREKWPLGAEVVVTGTCTVYNGQYEFNKGCGAVATGAKVDPATLTYVDATADFAAAKSNEDKALTEYQNRRVTLKDAFITRVKTEYKDGKLSKRYYYFTLGESNVEFNVYYTIYFIDEATMQALDAQLQVGNMVDLTGVISVYSFDFQVYPDSATSVSNVRQVVKTDADKIALEKKNLSLIDTAVKGDEIALPSAGVFESTQITWAFAEGKDYSAVATIADGKLTITADPAETVNLEVVATITSGSTSETVTFEVTIPAARTSFIKAALVAGAALEDKATTEDSYMIIGTISEITEAYSEQYGNVTFNVVDAEGNKLLIYRYKGENAATLKVGDAVAFAAPIKKYGSTIEAVSPFVALNITSLTDAAAAGLAGTGVDGTQVYGYVKSIDSAYSEQYGNITVTISDGTNDFYIYRLKGGEDIMLNDYILITGKPSSYKEAAQMAQGATYVKSPIYVAPAAPAEKVTTIEAALSATAGTPAELTGTVDRYNSADFKDSYYIKDEAGKEILVYRANVEANIGDVVKVVGTIGAYNGVNQIAQGSTVTVITPAGGETPAPHTCEHVCPVEGCGKCTDKDCTEDVCKNNQCPGHEAPAHTCEHVCPVEGCGKCTDKDCTETVCSENQCPGHEPAVVLEDVAINVGELADADFTGATVTDKNNNEVFQLTANSEIKVGSGIFVGVPSKTDGTTLVIDANTKDADGLTFTKRIKLGGTMGVADGAVTNGLKLDIKGAATITVYAMSSSSSADRVLVLATLADGALTTVAEQPALGASISKQTYTVAEAGTYYLGSSNSGINVYYIAISYGAEDAEVGGGETPDPVHTCEHVCPECNKCTDKDCTETVCADKCEGHTPAHTCESVCATCGKCTDTTCEEDICKNNQCEGHTITTIAGALAGKEGDKATFTGMVSGIYQNWDSYHGNMSVYVSDDQGNRIIVFRTTTQVGVGDIVTVSGTITIYQTTGIAQIAQGSTVTIDVKHECSEFTPASCLSAKICTVCGKADGEPLEHTDAADSNGKCDLCGTDMQSAAAQVTVTAKYTDTTTGNMTGNNDAATIGLDATIFNVKSAKTNGGTNHVGLNKAGNMRLYKDNTCTMTIAIAEGYQIVSIKVTLAASSKTAGNLVVTNGTDTLTADNGLYMINGSTVVFSNSGSDQVHIASIEIVYAPVAE